MWSIYEFFLLRPSWIFTIREVFLFMQLDNIQSKQELIEYQKLIADKVEADELTLVEVYEKTKLIEQKKKELNIKISSKDIFSRPC